MAQSLEAIKKLLKEYMDIKSIENIDLNNLGEHSSIHMIPDELILLLAKTAITRLRKQYPNELISIKGIQPAADPRHDEFREIHAVWTIDYSIDNNKTTTLFIDSSTCEVLDPKSIELLIEQLYKIPGNYAPTQYPDEFLAKLSRVEVKFKPIKPGKLLKEWDKITNKPTENKTQADTEFLKFPKPDSQKLEKCYNRAHQCWAMTFSDKQGSPPTRAHIKALYRDRELSSNNLLLSDSPPLRTKCPA